MKEDDVPPGAIACGFKVAAVKVNSLVPCAPATGTKMRSAARTHTNGASVFLSFNLDSDPSDLNMSRFQFSSFDSWDFEKAARRVRVPSGNCHFPQAPLEIC